MTTLNNKLEPVGSGCILGGTIYDDATGGSEAVADPSNDISGSQTFSMFKNGADKDLVSEVDPNSSEDTQGSLAVCYIKKQGDKLRINQER